MSQLEHWGTRDMASVIAMGEAVAFQEAIGAERIAARGRQLAGYVRERMEDTRWSELISPAHPEMIGSISTFRLSGFGDQNLGQALTQDFRITIPIHREKKDHVQRVSTHLYNTFDQIDQLLEALIHLRKNPFQA